MAQRSIIGTVCTLLLVCATSATATPSLQIEAIDVTPTRIRARPGDRLVFGVRGVSPESRAVVLMPGGGTREVALETGRPGEHRLQVTLPSDGAAGLYLIHVWTGDTQRPKALGKAAIVVGPIVMDFFLPAYLDRSNPLADLSAYLDDFRALGGNTLIAHALITPDQAYFPSAIARTTAKRGSPSDIVEQLLVETDRRGLSVFLSVSWDMTHPGPYRDRMRQIAALMAELFSLYAGHASLAGFYSYQEGSGTYYVPYVREFTGHVKSLNPGLLSACAPFVDDPLLAGYLSTVDTLDVMIFQGMVMASYRPDNRKKYPVRRVRDFAALGIGAKWLQDKIAITHVELFGYLEHRPDPAILAASYENIFGQIASVATAPGADGIALFAYHSHIWSARRDARVQRSRQAVADGLAVFRRMQGTIGPHLNPLTVYFPYSDWIVERWTTSILPALDAFRRAGIPVDILPYAPPIEESVYPYFPFHMNPAVLERLLSTRRVLVLPDVSGFQQTDSDLIDAFVKRGGVAIAFGPQIPMGRSFERDRLFGGRETGGSTPRGIRMSTGFGKRMKPDGSCTLPGPGEPAWSATDARVLATFDDGSPAILGNAYGAGLAVAVLPSAAATASGCPDLLRDVLEHALTHAGHSMLADVIGLSEASDVAVAPIPSGLAVAIVNHDSSTREVQIRSPAPGGSWVDVVSDRSLGTASGGQFRLAVPAGGVRIVELRREGRRHP
jgi:hypothetical protein